MSLKELLVSHLSCTVTSGAETRALLEILMKPSFNKYLLPPLKPPVLKPATLKPLTLKPPTLKPSSQQQISFAAIDILLMRLMVDTMPIIMTPAQWRRRRGSSRQSECIPNILLKETQRKNPTFEFGNMGWTRGKQAKPKQLSCSTVSKPSSLEGEACPGQLEAAHIAKDAPLQQQTYL